MEKSKRSRKDRRAIAQLKKRTAILIPEDQIPEHLILENILLKNGKFFDSANNVQLDVMMVGQIVQESYRRDEAIDCFAKEQKMDPVRVRADLKEAGLNPPPAATESVLLDLYAQKIAQELAAKSPQATLVGLGSQPDILIPGMCVDESNIEDTFPDQALSVEYSKSKDNNNTPLTPPPALGVIPRAPARATALAAPCARRGTP